MKRKIVGILVVTLLISLIFTPIINSMDKRDIIIHNNNREETQIANVYIKKYDPVEKTFYKELIKQITKEEAELIKEELLYVQENFETSEEVIRNQIDIMHKWGLLNSEIVFDDFEGLLKYEKQILKNIDFPTISTDVTILGPSIISFLTIGGGIFPLHLIFWDLIGPIWWNSTRFDFDIFGGTAIAAQILISPAMALYCSAMTFINSFGVVIGPNFVISPFISILVGVAGFSITVNIFTDGFEFNAFDWSVGFCVTGLIAYISTIQP
jgi:hypothetical protein